jgi:hypothetical protein
MRTASRDDENLFSFFNLSKVCVSWPGPTQGSSKDETTSKLVIGAQLAFIHPLPDSSPKLMKNHL